MNLGEFVQGMLTGFVLGGGLTWWACHRGLRMALGRVAGEQQLRAVDPHGDLMSDTQVWEPSYREPANVQAARVTHVFCGDCKFQVDRACLASPVKPHTLGAIDQVTGLARPPEYEPCVIVNKNYNCKKKVLK